MKKILYIMSAVALLFASCAKESDNGWQGDTNEVILCAVADFSYSDGGAAAEPMTRAAAAVNNYVLDIYTDAEYTDAGKLSRKTSTDGTFILTGLDRTKQYYCLLWADNDPAVYNTESLKAVSLNLNKQAVEAFFGRLTISGGNATTSITLKRAVAKINLCDKEGMEADLSVNLKYTQPETFSVADGSVSGTRAEDYSLTSVVAAADETFASFSMLAGADVATFDLTFQFEGEAAGTTVTDITYQANYRTNIQGGFGVYKFKAGDYYYSDNTCSTTLDPDKTCIGVVFWINPQNRSQGKIVSLDQGIGFWGPNWEEEGVSSEDDGAANTRTLITARKDQSDFASSYQAFNWIYTTKNNSNVDGRWYLPALNELKALRGEQGDEVMQKVNAALEKIPGAVKIDTEVTEDHWYWSSTESGGVAMAFRYDTGKTLTGAKAGDCAYRGVSVFEIN